MAFCQPVSLTQLTVIIERLRNAPLTEAERAEHERFFLKCVASADALELIRHPETHPANPQPGSVPAPAVLARIAAAMH